MADTKSLTITLGAGNFSFTILEALKSYYAEGETVKIHYEIKNNGNITAKATIVASDDDTGLDITTYVIADVEPGESIKTVEPHATLGKMPNKDWNVTFKLFP